MKKKKQTAAAKKAKKNTKAAAKPKKKTAARKPAASEPSLNVPQLENLLEEEAYIEEIAPFFDEMYPASVVEKVHGPFLKMLVQKYKVQSACDLACRTGQTLALLKKFGIKRLVGVDGSDANLAIARKKLGKDATVDRYPLREAPASLDGQTFDMVLCTKDSLPSVLDDEGLFEFFKKVYSLLSPTGVFVAEIINYGKVWKQRERYQPIMDRTKKSGGHMFFYMHEFTNELLVRHLVRLEKSKSEWFLRATGTPIRPLQPNEIELFVKEAGFSKWGFLGSYAGKPYVEKESLYTILLALK